MHGNGPERGGGGPGCLYLKTDGNQLASFTLHGSFSHVPQTRQGLVEIAQLRDPLGTPARRGNMQDPRDTIRLAAKDDSLTKIRSELARFAAETFSDAGQEIHVLGSLNRSDETVAVAILLRIASQLVSASADMLIDGRPYAAAALVRQIVEVEYLAWAIATREGDGERWLRSDRRQREEFFTPAKLRKAAQGTFRGKDYSYHCELGGHPVPSGASGLLDGDPAVNQLLLADMLGHAGRIWDHLADWSRGSSNGTPILTRRRQMWERFSKWKSLDPMVDLPPPP